MAQQTRNVVSGLAEQRADMLAFLNEIEVLKKVQVLEVTNHFTFMVTLDTRVHHSSWHNVNLSVVYIL